MADMKFASFFLLISIHSLALCHAAESTRRVQPPVWSQDVLDAFFEDAREQLDGARPQRDAREVVGTSVANPTIDGGQPTDSIQKWSTLIDAETLTSAIKQSRYQLHNTVRMAQSMVRGTDKIFRRDFALLSVLLGIVADFDTEIRWQRSAAFLQTECLQASQNFQEHSAHRLRIAKDVLTLLEELLRGQTPAGETASHGTDELELVDRTLLMQSMELAVKARLKPALANSREFRKRSQLAFEQAQLLAVLAEVIQKEGYEYTDDDTYLDEARQLRNAAQELVQAARDKNYEAARAAAGQVGQSCSRCHEGYRG